MLQIFLDTQSVLTFSLKESNVINYNNYTNCISNDYNLDYRDGKFALSEPTLFGSKLTIFDTDEKTNVYRKFSSYFQLCGKQIVYLNSGDLFLSNFDTQTMIASKVDTYVAHKEGIVYSINVGETEQFSIYWYDFESQNHVLVTENAVQYCLSDDKLAVLTEDSWITVYTKEEAEKYLQIEIDKWPFDFQLCNNQIVYLNSECHLKIVGLDTKELHTVKLNESSLSNSRIAYICNDEQIYCSFQATHTNGSIVNSIAMKTNGIWVINSVTLEKRKICDETFERLYLFDSDLLIGIKDGDAYQIDVTTGNTLKVLK